jgi:hypothetical protein
MPAGAASSSEALAGAGCRRAGPRCCNSDAGLTPQHPAKRCVRDAQGLQHTFLRDGIERITQRQVDADQDCA